MRTNISTKFVGPNYKHCRIISFFGTKGHGDLDFFFFFFFFFFDLGFTALSRIFHLYRADCSSKVGENRRTRRKTT